MFRLSSYSRHSILRPPTPMITRKSMIPPGRIWNGKVVSTNQVRTFKTSKHSRVHGNSLTLKKVGIVTSLTIIGGAASYELNRWQHRQMHIYKDGKIIELSDDINISDFKRLIEQLVTNKDATHLIEIIKKIEKGAISFQSIDPKKLIRQKLINCGDDEFMIQVISSFDLENELQIELCKEAIDSSNLRLIDLYLERGVFITDSDCTLIEYAPIVYAYNNNKEIFKYLLKNGDFNISEIRFKGMSGKKYSRFDKWSLACLVVKNGDLETVKFLENFDGVLQPTTENYKKHTIDPFICSLKFYNKDVTDYLFNKALKNESYWEEVKQVALLTASRENNTQMIFSLMEKKVDPFLCTHFYRKDRTVLGLAAKNLNVVVFKALLDRIDVPFDQEQKYKWVDFFGNKIDHSQQNTAYYCYTDYGKKVIYVEEFINEKIDSLNNILKSGQQENQEDREWDLDRLQRKINKLLRMKEVYLKHQKKLKSKDRV